MLNGIGVRSQQYQPLRNYKYRRLSKSDDEEDHDWEENIELLNRVPNRLKTDGSLKKFDVDEIVERPIYQGESLTSISLKYRIPVADLKRINKLQKETEFYALRSLKIPVKSNSVLHDLLQEELNEKEKNEETTAFHTRKKSNNDDENDLDKTLSGVISISQICKEKQTRAEAKHFLQNMQKDLQKLQEKTNSYKGSLDEAAASLTSVAFSPMENRMFGCSDQDFSWWRILALGGTLVIIVPFIYILVSLTLNS